MPLLPLDDQHTHRAYIRAVAHALTAAGIHVRTVSFPHDDEDPDLCLLRRAVLEVDMRSTWLVYGDQEVCLLWDDEGGWRLGWGPAGGALLGASFTICPTLVPDPAEVASTVRADLKAPPEWNMPCPSRSCWDHDERLEALLDVYTAQEDMGVAAVWDRLDSLLQPVLQVGDVPGYLEERDRPSIALLLALARKLSGGEREAVERAAVHLAVMALWCPKPTEHHAHQSGPVVYAPDVEFLLAQEVYARNYSIRGLAHRYAHLGVGRSTVRRVLWALDPEYMGDLEARHGPRRRTSRDHAGNRARRRR
ncbi:MAG TPA: DUF6292 family protein, partial [Streptomyces sp.]|nr:DUF6292 family protein [Streptomyces sp.]